MQTLTTADSVVVRKVAAMALAAVKATSSADVLMGIVQDRAADWDLRRACMKALAFMHDTRLVPILFEINKERRVGIGGLLETLIGLRFEVVPAADRKRRVEEFPELGEFSDPDLPWTHWWQVRDEWTREQFNKYWGEIERLRRMPAPPEESITANMARIHRLGMSALPYMMEKVEEGESGFVPYVSDLSGRVFPREGSSAADAIAWWEANRGKLTIVTGDGAGEP